MARIGDDLYYGRVDGNLIRVSMDGNTPVDGSRLIISGPAIDGRDWSGGALAFFSAGQLFNPEPDRAAFDSSSSGSTGSGSWQVFNFPAKAGEPINVQLLWENPAAELNMFLRDPTGTTVARNVTSSGSPKWITETASFGGSWSVGVKINAGATDYDVLVNPFEEPPAPRAEHEFSSTACDSRDSFQSFRFPVSVGDDVDVTLEWDDPSAKVNLFLQDDTRSSVGRDVSVAGSAKTLSSSARTSGRWSVGVNVKEGCTDYAVLVNAIGGETGSPMPEPVSRWELDGNFLDAVGNNHGSSLVGPAFEDIDAACHYALFNGSANQFIEVPYTPELNTSNFTVSLWVRSDGGAGTRSMLASRWETEGRENRFGWAVFESSLDRWMWLTGEGARDHDQPGTNVGEDVWTHIAFTFAQEGNDENGIPRGKKRFYINGTQVDQRSGSLQVNDTAPLTIGARSTVGKIGNTNRYVGAIDEVQVFNQALNGAQVNQVRFAHPGCSGL